MPRLPSTPTSETSQSLPDDESSLSHDDDPFAHLDEILEFDIEETCAVPSLASERDALSVYGNQTQAFNPEFVETPPLAIGEGFVSFLPTLH